MTPMLTLWWLLVNVLTCALSLDFLQKATGTGTRNQQLPWLLLTLSITRLVLRYQIPAAFFLSLFVTLLFGRFTLKQSWQTLAPPLAVLFTLSTILEGFSALTMAWAATTLPSPTWGMIFQIIVSLTANASLCLALHFIRTRFLTPGQHPKSDLYVLLLPCAVFILGLRGALHLDTRTFAPYLCALNPSGTFLLTLLLIGGVLLLLFQLRTLYHLLLPARREQALLREVQTRDTAFRHDLKNHLLVLTNLIEDQNYTSAQHYAAALHHRTATLSPTPPTGRPALDALLSEKLTQAEEDGIQLHLQAVIPPSSQIPDLDLCALFANLLDNAFHACQNLEREQRTITLQTTARGNLLLIEAENPVQSTHPITPGTGLQNVRRIAQAHQGTVQITQSNNTFRIRVLLSSP